MSLVFQASDQPAAARVDYWHHVMGETICPLEMRIDGTHHVPERLVVGEAGPIRVGELTLRRGGAERTRRLIRRSDPEMYKIDVQARGRTVVAQDGRESQQEIGDFTFVDLSRPARWFNSSATLVAVLFPRSLLPLDPNEVARLTGVRIRGDRGAGALVSAYARRLLTHVDECGATERARLGATMLDLVVTALAAQLGERVPPETGRRALLLRVHAYIEQHLGDPGLTPPSIAAAQYISVRYLHRLFETEQTTVADWIRRRRLERCRRDLLDPGLASRPVSAIAARWGLTSPAHFSRAFRAAYGMPPAEYRLSAAA
jgi:AraC-like DNA-binding protein